MKAAWTALAAASLLVGCAKDVDRSQIEQEDGLVYITGEDKPFTGTVLNLSSGEVLPKEATALLINWNQFASFHSLLSSEGSAKPRSIIDDMVRFKNNVVCDASFSEGVFDGEFSCHSGRKKGLIAGRFKEGALDGEFYVFSKGMSHKLIEAKFEDGLLDGEMIYRPEDKDLIVYSRGVRKGLANGTTKRFDYNTGKIAEESAWTGGKRSGDLLSYNQSGQVVERKTPDEKVFILNDATGNFIPVSKLESAKFEEQRHYRLQEGKRIAMYMQPGALASEPSYSHIVYEGFSIDGCFEGWCSVDHGARWVKEQDLKALAVPVDYSTSEVSAEPSKLAVQEANTGETDSDSMKSYYLELFVEGKWPCAKQNYTDKCVPKEADEYAMEFEQMIDEDVHWSTDEILELSREGIGRFGGERLRAPFCGKYQAQLESTGHYRACLAGMYGD